MERKTRRHAAEMQEHHLRSGFTRETYLAFARGKLKGLKGSQLVFHTRTFQGVPNGSPSPPLRDLQPGHLFIQRPIVAAGLLPRPFRVWENHPKCRNAVACSVVSSRNGRETGTINSCFQWSVMSVWMSTIN